jgi:transposase
MMGIKSYQEKMLYNFSLTSRIPQDHLVRKLANVVDLRFVRDLVADKYSHTGQRSIDPEVLFKMMLLGYLYGITSERRLAEDIAVNMAYMWYLGYDVDEQTPHHSVISKARARYGKAVFEEFFNRILEQCVKAGLVNGEKVFADSTYIRADASMQSLVARETVEPALSSKEFVEKLFEDNPVKDTEQSSKNNTKDGFGSPPKGVSNKDYVSKTDPDSAIVCHGKKLPLQLAYKEHFTVDSQARVITAVEITNASIDDGAMLSKLIEQQPVPIKELGADTKYGTFQNYAYLIQRNILPSINPWLGGNPSKEHRFDHTQFMYDNKTDTYICPSGNRLCKGNDQLIRDRFTYRSKKRDCKSCNLREKCITAYKGYRMIFRHFLHEFKDKALQHLATEHAKETLRQRKTFAEWINAESKTRHGLRRAMFRGLDNVSIQVLLTASVQNIKRLMKHLPSPVKIFKELSYKLHRYLSFYSFKELFA